MGAARLRSGRGPARHAAQSESARSPSTERSWNSSSTTAATPARPGSCARRWAKLHSKTHIESHLQDGIEFSHAAHLGAKQQQRHVCCEAGAAGWGRARLCAESLHDERCCWLRPGKPEGAKLRRTCSGGQGVREPGILPCALCEGMHMREARERRTSCVQHARHRHADGSQEQQHARHRRGKVRATYGRACSARQHAGGGSPRLGRSEASQHAGGQAARGGARAAGGAAARRW